ncbi:Ubiquitin carboxyl-terminal hydrolase 13 [Echinococcus granulosus]|nr:Ubiquitin carboxyl-terminal hydrolase 13 [Echinococcus granulosus]
MEMEVEANVRVGEWLTLQDADRTLTPLHGPGVTGLVNLGNTSYINWAVEVLFATEAFRGRYALALPSYVDAAMDAVADNGSATAVIESFGLQMSKLSQVLWFGVYSITPIGIGEMKGGEVVRKQPDIRPRMFRHVMGRTNADFASKQQQDVQEFLVYHFDLVEHEVQYKEQVEMILCLPIPVEAATNKDEVNAYKKAETK